MFVALSYASACPEECERKLRDLKSQIEELKTKTRELRREFDSISVSEDEEEGRIVHL